LARNEFSALLDRLAKFLLLALTSVYFFCNECQKAMHAEIAKAARSIPLGNYI